MSLMKPLVALAAFGCLGLAGTAAFAQTCTSDADCMQGFTCQVAGVVIDNAPCKPGTDCLNRGVSGSTGTTSTVSSCQPAPCATDSDCGADMVCYAQSSTSCSGSGGRPACSPDSKSCDPTPVTTEACITTTSSACVFRWQRPCNADADCGAGFVCQPEESGVCSGGTPSGGSGSGSGVGGNTGGPTMTGPNMPADLPPSSCTTITSFPGYCQVQVTSCIVDADCPAHWQCVDVPVAVPIAAPAAAGGSAGGADVAVTGAGDAAGTAPPPNPGKVCSSPYFSPVGTKGDGSGSGAGGYTGETPTSGTPPPSPGGSVDSSTGTGGTTAGPSHSGSGGSQGGTMASGTVAGGGSNGATGNRSGSASDTTSSAGGCSVNPGRAASGAPLALLALVGLGMVTRRRQR